MSRLLLTAAVLAVMVYAMVLGVRWLSPKIEQDIANRATTALAEQGLLWADVAVEGRKVTLSGVAPSEESRTKALTAASRVFGVAQVQDNLTLASGTEVLSKTARQLAKAYTLTIAKQGEKVTLSGNVASEADKAVLLRLAAPTTTASKMSIAPTSPSSKAPPPAGAPPQAPCCLTSRI